MYRKIFEIVLNVIYIILYIQKSFSLSTVLTVAPRSTAYIIHDFITDKGHKDVSTNLNKNNT